MFPEDLLKPDSIAFEENLWGQLTIFLDFILTKYFRKRDVNECQITRNEGHFATNRLMIYPIT